MKHQNQKIGYKHSNIHGRIWELFKTNATLDEIREVAARLCREYLTGRWKIVAAEQLNVKRITGGLSNYLYYVSLPADIAMTTAELPSSALTIADNDKNSPKHSSYGGIGDKNANKRPRTDSTSSSCAQSKEPQEVLLRVYGQSHGEDLLDTMITESVVFALLSERNFGPKLHGIFPGGRIEQYIPARPLTTSELADPRISIRIAEKMSEIHCLDIPLSKEPTWAWNCMNRWLKTAESIFKKTDWTQSQKTHLQSVRSFDYHSEINWIKRMINEGNHTVLFCHNDFQEGNILFRESTIVETTKHPPALGNSLSNSRSSYEDLDINPSESIPEKEGEESRRENTTDINSTRDSSKDNNSEEFNPELIIIDFEYCAYNYRGFDIANHFLEWTFDYMNPTAPFFYHDVKKFPTKQQQQEFITVYLRKLHDFIPSIEEVESVEQEVQIFCLLSHLFWSLWSVVNTTSNIEFGYWEYASARIKEYNMLKQKLIQN